MWIDKLACGVLELDTPIGPRYLEPSLIQRVRLLWTFRNFSCLPQQVLRPSEVRMIDQISNANCILSSTAIAADDRPIIGRVERRTPAPVDAFAKRKPMSSAVGDAGRQAAA